MPQDPWAVVKTEDAAPSDPWAVVSHVDTPKPSAVPQQVLDTLRRNINSRAGGMGYDDSSVQVPSDPGVLSGLTRAAGNLLSLPKAVAGGPQNAEEQGVYNAGSANMAGSQGTLAMYRLGIKPSMDSIDKANMYDLKAQAAPQGTNTQTYSPQHMANAMRIGAVIPGVGPMAANLVERAGGGDVTGALTEGAAYRGAGAATDAVLGKTGTYLDNRANGIPSLPEPPSRTIMKSIGPREMDMQPLQDAIDAQHGNITQFAQQNKLPLNTRLDYANAARGYAETQKRFYENQILNPVADETVSAPNKFKGYTTGEANNWTTIGSLEERLRSINAEQNSIHNSPTEALTREALTKDAELTAEAASIRSSLYSEIGKRTNLTPDQVQQIRQQFGTPQTIADMTTRAVNREVAMETRQSRGTTTVPDGRMGAVNMLVNKMRGGAVKIGDAQFRSALQSSPMPAADALQPQILPQQSSPYQSVWGDTTGTPAPSMMDQSAPPSVNIETLRQKLANRGGNVSARDAAAQTIQDSIANRLAARRMMVDASRK